MNGPIASSDWLNSHQTTRAAMPTNIKRLRSRRVTRSGGISGSRLPTSTSVCSLLNMTFRNVSSIWDVLNVVILTYPFRRQQGSARDL